MKYIIDHDYHIHSTLSLCCHDPEQTKENILRVAKEQGLKKICMTDHFWDENVPFWDALASGASQWYSQQNFAHLSEILPLPKDNEVEFVFGCECDMDKYMTLGLSKESYNKFGFIVISTTHLHMKGLVMEKTATLEERAEAYVKRLDAVLDMELPFHKVGIAHLTAIHIANANKETAHEDHIKVIDMVSDSDYIRLFTKSAERGCGIELNFPIAKYNSEEIEHILRPYRIAKACGNKFYMGSDAHSVAAMTSNRARFSAYIDALELNETDKFEF